MLGTDITRLTRVLLYGSDESRHHAARTLLSEDSSELWPMLAATVRSDEPWLLRVRSLEALGIAAAAADEATAETILTALLPRDA